MNAIARVTVAALVLLSASEGMAQKSRNVPTGLEVDLRRFFSSKHTQAIALAKEEGKEQRKVAWDFFAAGEKGDWPTVETTYKQLRTATLPDEGGKRDPRFETMVWRPVIECYGAYEQCANGEEKYVKEFGRDILESIPRGSIYFGGNAAGLWLPILFSRSHPVGDPCFILTQSGLADALYLKYARTMYGDRVAGLTDQNSEEALAEYKTDARKRLQEGKLKPGEDVKESADGKIQASGHVALMGINALMAKKIFEANPRQEFYVQESFPLDWMYPHLTPHGLIMKINREPLDSVPAEIVQKDQVYWTRLVNGALGKWLAPTTSVETVCDFAKRVFKQKEPGPFKPDEKFVSNAHACNMYSKARSSIAGAYAWRAAHSKTAAEKERMQRAADFAFRQAVALQPESTEVVFRYIAFLNEQKRIKEALLIAETAASIQPGSNFDGLVTELRKLQ